MKKTILALAAAGALAAPAFGAGDIFQFAAETSDLENTQSVSQLYERLDMAVMEYCADLVDEPQLDACHTQVLDAVVAQFNSADLMARHERATGASDNVELAARDDGV
ncbi:UrcA family protein [Hyphobacterium sp. CCMP332]|jgi:UrcA family protein|uniref:UrcA family protein n=1 Tax=Hyphobacterium sp. CCMP332 TaxID=2749086 RepID=UPI00164F9A76|nr:UrcA family protein [Hyphobacterium sp. CCMP332]QNL19598.1 UrcA family protein [Hyphobacterium sp. CCMP332]